MTNTPVWTQRNSPAYTRISLALFLAGFATFSLVYSVQPLLPLLVEDFQVSAGESSLAVSLTTGSLAISIVIAGAISEAVGRKGLMAVSICAASLLNLVAAVAPHWHVLLAARGLLGVVIGGVPAVAMAYLAEEIDPRDLGAAMGLYVGGSALGGMTGRVVVGAVTEWLSWRAGLSVIALSGLLCTAGFWLLLPASRNFCRHPGINIRFHLAAWAGHLQTPALCGLFFLGLAMMGTFVTIYNYIGFLLLAPPYTLSHTHIGLIFTAYLAGVIASWRAGSLCDRLGRPPVLLGGLATLVSGLLLTLSPPLWAVITGLVLLTTGFFIAHSVASSWVGRLAGHNKGHAASLYLLAYYTGSSTAGTAGGWFWTHGGWPLVIAFTCSLSLAALPVALWLRRLSLDGKIAA